jgi:hypothetical protein
MQLDLRGRAAAQKFSREAIEFSCALDLSHLTRWGEKPFPEPVRVSGSAVYNGDFFELAYGVEFGLHTVCARCLKSLVLADRLEFSHIVMEANENSEHWRTLSPCTTACWSWTIWFRPICCWSWRALRCAHPIAAGSVRNAGAA